MHHQPQYFVSELKYDNSYALLMKRNERLVKSYGLFKRIFPVLYVIR